jgi:hypothetical protein
MAHYSTKLVKSLKHFTQNIVLNQLLLGTRQSNNSNEKKINYFENNFTYF